MTITGPARRANTFTVEVPDLPEGHSVRLVLVDAAGTSVPVPLQQLQILGGPAEAHGSDSHDSGGDSHGEADSHGGGGHGAEVPGAEGPTFRGKVSLKAAGSWTAVLQVVDGHGKPLASAEQAIGRSTQAPTHA